MGFHYSFILVAMLASSTQATIDLCGHTFTPIVEKDFPGKKVRSTNPPAIIMFQDNNVVTINFSITDIDCIADKIDRVGTYSMAQSLNNSSVIIITLENNQQIAFTCQEEADHISLQEPLMGKTFFATR